MASGSPTAHENPRRGSRVLERATALLLGLALVPILLEIGLRAAALLVSNSRAHEPGDCLVLCQGDSNMFGLYVPEPCALPGQLQTLLRGGGLEGARVVNRGVVGKATWVVRDEIEADLERYRPRAVAVLAGINSRWSLPPEEERWPWIGKLRVVRCWRLFRNAWNEDRALASRDPMAERAAAPSEVRDVPPAASIVDLDPTRQRISMADRTGRVRPFLMVFGQPATEEFQRWIREDLIEVAARVRRAGAKPFFLLYPLQEGTFVEINEAIEDAAAQSGATLVDSRGAFAQALETMGRDRLVFRDCHATEAGYAIVARELLRALVADGVVEASVADGLDLEQGALGPPLSLEVVASSPDHASAAVTVQYAPGYAAQLLVSGTEGEVRIGFVPHKEAIELAPPGSGQPFALGDDKLLRACVAHQEALRVHLDAQGRGEIVFPPPGRSITWPAQARAIVLIVDPFGGLIAESEVFLLQPKR
jgi:lysophospholipase L1-like esterase